MDIQKIRDNFLVYVLAMGVCVLVLGGILIVILRTYYWDTSRLTLQLPEWENNVTLRVQARLIYRDIDILGFFLYPIHVTLEKKIVTQCMNSCTIEGIPQWDAELVFSGEDELENINIFISPDTDGTLDLRPSFVIKKIQPSKEVIYDTSLVPEGVGKNIFVNRIQGITLGKENNEVVLYDHKTRQMFYPPFSQTESVTVARGSIDGVYIFSTGIQYITWDRYGRTPITYLPAIAYQWYEMSLDNGNTLITKDWKTQKLSWIWLPFHKNGSIVITDGENLSEIR